MQRKVRNVKRSKFSARKARTAKHITGSARPRLTVYRSAKHIYALLVDPHSGKTITSVSTRSRQAAGEAGEGEAGKVAAAARVGRAIAELAGQRQIRQVVFNRNGFLYHGRVKALADAARENGLEF